MFAAYASSATNQDTCSDKNNVSNFPSYSSAPTESDKPLWLTNDSYKVKSDNEVEEIISSNDESVKATNTVITIQVDSDKEKKPKKRKLKKEKKRPSVELVEARASTSKPVEKPIWCFEPTPSAIIDARGDKQNYGFATTYKREVAKHFYHNVFKLPSHIAFEGKKTSIEEIKRKQQERYYSRQRIRRFLKNEPKAMHGTRNREEFTGVVPLQITKFIDEQTGNELIWDDQLQMYKAKPENDDLPPLQRLERDLKAIVEKEPKNISKWIELIKLQPRLLSNKQAENDESKVYNPKRHIAERQIAIVEKAIKLNGLDVQLALLRIRIAADASLWEEAQIEREWQQLRFKHINSIAMWRAWLQYSRTQFRKFTLTAISSIYDECIGRLQLVLSGTMLSHPPPPDGHSRLLDIIMEKIQMIIYTGHTERGIAALQALVEYALFQPPRLTQETTEMKKATFEQWWSKKPALFGEPDAQGWYKTDQPNSVSESMSDQDTLLEEEANIFEKLKIQHFETEVERTGYIWLKLEQMRSLHQWKAVSPDSEVDDPDCIVVFDDIKSILIDVTSDSDRFRLVLFALRLIGLRIPRISTSTGTKDDFAFGDFDFLFPDYFLDKHAPLFGAINLDSFQQHAIRQLRDLYTNDIVKSTFLAAIELESRMYSLLQESNSWSSVERETALKKIAKRFLSNKASGGAPIFYTIYAHYLAEIECSNTQLDILKLVFTSNSELIAKTLRDDKMIEPCFATLVALRVMADYCEAKLRYALNLEDLVNLTKIAASALYSTSKDSVPLLLVKMIKTLANTVSQRLKELNERVQISSRCDLSLNWLGSKLELLVRVYSVMLYSSSTKQFSHAIQILDDSIMTFYEKLQHQSTQNTYFNLASERLYELKILLQTKHISLNPTVPPSLLTECLRDAITWCPNNTIITRHFVQRLSMGLQRLSLRRHFSKRMKCNDVAVAELIGAVYTECYRYATAANQLRSMRANLSINNIRSALREVTELAPECWQLWMLWMRIEHEHATASRYKEQQKRVAPIDGVFYRAVGACPYVLSLYLYYLECSPKEWPVVVDLLTEKNLRLRLPQEELELLMNANGLSCIDGRKKNDEDDVNDDELMKE